jgi:chorismate dehydratase
VTRTVRLGAVSYLNVRPLVEGIGSANPNPGTPEPSNPGTSEPRNPGTTTVLTLRFDIPSVCAQLLADGGIDLGMVPSITYVDRPDDRIVPGVCIGSDGPVASVALFSRRPLRQVRTIALDTSSRTSAALTRILCARAWHISPNFRPHAPDLESMLATADAALLIGDPALFRDHRSLGADKIDLGQAWATMTGLPFVWAFWSGRSDAVDRDVVRRLQQARERGIAASDAIADAYCAGDPPRQAVARAYLRDNMRYDLDERAIRGLTTYFEEAAQLGLVRGPRQIEFFGA